MRRTNVERATGRICISLFVAFIRSNSQLGSNIVFVKCWKHVYSQTTEFAVHVLLKVSLSMEFTSIELLLVYNLCDYPERRRISNQPSNPFFWFYAVLEVNAVQGLNASAADRPNTTINAHPQT